MPACPNLRSSRRFTNFSRVLKSMKSCLSPAACECSFHLPGPSAPPREKAPRGVAGGFSCGLQLGWHPQELVPVKTSSSHSSLLELMFRHYRSLLLQKGKKLHYILALAVSIGLNKVLSLTHLLTFFCCLWDEVCHIRWCKVRFEILIATELKHFERNLNFLVISGDGFTGKILFCARTKYFSWK